MSTSSAAKKSAEVSRSYTYALWLPSYLRTLLQGSRADPSGNRFRSARYHVTRHWVVTS